MKAYVAVTDKGWFEHLRILSRHGRVQEVNFWTPKEMGWSVPRARPRSASSTSIICSSSTTSPT